MHIIEEQRVFHSMSGTLVRINALTFILDVASIEWIMESCTHSIEKIRPYLQQRVTVFTHLYHREDQLQLFGFADEESRHAFCELIRLNGIGPKQALKILSQLSSDQLWSGVQADNMELFESISGLGKKTAAKLLISLKDRVPELPSHRHTDMSPFQDIVDGLVSMGYHRDVVFHTIAQYSKKKDLSRIDESVLFKELLQQLGEKNA